PAGEQHGVHQILHKQNVAYLAAVTVKRKRLALHGANQKVGDPALVLGSKLMGAVDAAHAEHGGGNSISAGVIQYILFGSAFGATVRTVEIQSLGLGDRRRLLRI